MIVTSLNPPHPRLHTSSTFYSTFSFLFTLSSFSFIIPLLLQFLHSSVPLFSPSLSHYRTFLLFALFLPPFSLYFFLPLHALFLLSFHSASPSTLSFFSSFIPFTLFFSFTLIFSSPSFLYPSLSLLMSNFIILLFFRFFFSFLPLRFLFLLHSSFLSSPSYFLSSLLFILPLLLLIHYFSSLPFTLLFFFPFMPLPFLSLFLTFFTLLFFTPIIFTLLSPSKSVTEHIFEWIKLYKRSSTVDNFMLVGWFFTVSFNADLNFKQFSLV